MKAGMTLFQINERLARDMTQDNLAQAIRMFDLHLTFRCVSACSDPLVSIVTGSAFLFARSVFVPKQQQLASPSANTVVSDVLRSNSMSVVSLNECISLFDSMFTS